MAQTGFQIQNWARSSTGANEPVQTDSGLVNGCFREYSYYSPVDTQATVSASGYFNSVNTDLVTGDTIRVYSLSENTYVTYQATNTNGVITLSSLLTGGQVSSYVQIPLTNAQILGMYAAPVLVVAAPGAGNLILVDKYSLNLVYNTAAFANGGAAALQYTNTVDGAGTNAGATTIAATEFTSLSANQIISVLGLQANTTTSGIINTGLYFSNASGAFTNASGGLSTGLLNVWYRVVAAS